MTTLDQTRQAVADKYQPILDSLTARLRKLSGTPYIWLHNYNTDEASRTYRLNQYGQLTMGRERTSAALDLHTSRPYDIKRFVKDIPEIIRYIERREQEDCDELAALL